MLPCRPLHTANSVCAFQGSLVLGDAPDTPGNAAPPARISTLGGQGWVDDPSLSVPSRGCFKVHKEKIHPGGFGASIMRLLWKFEKIWLLKEQDLVYDDTIWSYRCSKTSSWGCYFKQMLPCIDPEKTPTTKARYVKTSKKHLLLSDWLDRGLKTANDTAPPAPHPDEVAKVARELRHLSADADRLLFMRRLAKRLLQLEPPVLARVKTRVASAGLDLSKPFVSIHFRRGDKARESGSTSPDVQTLVSTVQKMGMKFDWVFVLTDDVRAVKELEEEAPSWKIKSFADPAAIGFNECMLPSVREVRKSACGKWCENLTAAAQGAMKRRSYCFMNPLEPDNAKLIPVPKTSAAEAASIQGTAGFNMLVDTWIATHAMTHISLGCGSNVDKLIHVLRPQDPNSTICFDVKGKGRYGAPGKECKGCTLRTCRINPEAGILGLNCEYSVTT